MRTTLARLSLLLAAVATAGASQTPRQTPRVIEIAAERFEFWPSEIVLTEGEEVEFRITSDDTAHGFRIVGAGTNVVVPKRGQGRATTVFKAGKPGRYTFECSRMCGAGHNFMRGTIVVRAASKDTRLKPRPTEDTRPKPRPTEDTRPKPRPTEESSSR